jgi:hypothetical protein
LSAFGLLQLATVTEYKLNRKCGVRHVHALEQMVVPRIALRNKLLPRLWLIGL